jgi:hypothetical protein
MQGYADRELPTKRIQSIVAYVSAPTAMTSQIQTSIAEEARKRGVISQDALAIFPPTRRYSNAEIQQGLARDRIDAILAVEIGDSGVIRQYAGTYFSSQTTGDFSASGTANRMGNLTNIGLQGTSNSTTSGMSTPVYRHSRQTDFVARLVDPLTGRNLWVGRGQVQASGRLFVGTGTGASSSIAAIFDDMEKKGLLAGAGT